MGAPAARVAELSRHWAQDGHEVTVLTGFPNHPTGVVPAGVPRQIPSSRGSRKCGRSERSPYLAAAVSQPQDARAHVELRLVLPVFRRHWPVHAASRCGHRQFSTTAGRTFRLVAGSVQAVSFVFEVRDLWPESLAAVGVGNPDSLFHRSLARIAGFLYRNSDHIVVVAPAFKEYLTQNWRLSPKKISVVENGVETDLFNPKGGERSAKGIGR